MDKRLDQMSKLIARNEQLQNQLKVSKKRLEKFKNEQLAGFQKQMSDKDSEVEVLKEMLKGV